MIAIMVNKSRYYAHVSGLDEFETAPDVSGCHPQYAEAINAIADDDPGFLEWIDDKEGTAELADLDKKMSRGLEDLIDAMLASGALTGNEPELAYAYSNKAKKKAARDKLK